MTKNEPGKCLGVTEKRKQRREKREKRKEKNFSLFTFLFSIPTSKKYYLCIGFNYQDI